MIKTLQNLFLKPNLSAINRTLILNRHFSNTVILKNSQENIKNEIEKLVKNDSVVVFMKGTANAPRCGFSKGVVQILNLHKVKFEAYNVLDREDLRSGIKEFTNWPTIPQVFFKGEFVGGYDILLDMHQTGELKKELEALGLDSKLETNNNKDQ